MATARATDSHTPGAKVSHSGVGNVTASWLTQVAGTLTVCSSASHLATPRATPSIPRVAMKGTTRRRVITRAFTRPTSPPARTPRPTAARGAPPLRRWRAAITPVRAMAEPTERSIPPLTMIRVMPIAPRATITVCASTTRRLLAERYRSGAPVATAKTRITARRPTKGPKRSSQARVVAFMRRSPLPSRPRASIPPPDALRPAGPGSSPRAGRRGRGARADRS